jgi:hypothetical protein
MSAFLPGVPRSLLVPPGSVGGVAIGVDKLAVTRPVPPKVRLCVSSRAGGIFHCCQERR